MSDGPTIGKLSRIPLRQVWRHEALDFTRWLEENLDVLNDHLDVPLVSADREQSTGVFNVDLLGEDEAGRTVVIENQLERSNHDHLGKLITYLAAFDADVAIWITSSATNEHVKAVTWLNDSSTALVYLFRVEAVQIGDSPPALLLTPIVQPSAEAKEVAASKKEQAARHVGRRAYWERLLTIANEVSKLHSGISPGAHPYISTGAGTRGLSYQYWVTRTDARVVLWIDRGKENEAVNLSIFDQLFAKREEVEMTFGGPLDWERMEEARSCKVVGEVPGAPGWQDDLDEREPGLRALAEAMQRFERAFAPHIARLDTSPRTADPLDTSASSPVIPVAARPS
jgi:hypothetical protein